MTYFIVFTAGFISALASLYIIIRILEDEE